MKFLILLLGIAFLNTSTAAEEASAPKTSATLPSAPTPALNPRLSQVELQWEEDTRAVEYQLEIKDLNGKVLKIVKTKTGTFKVQMPVNKYMVRGRFKTLMGNLSPWSQEFELVVPPKKVNFPIYKNNELSFAPSPKTLTAKVVVKWTPSPNADRYIFKIKDENGVVIKEITIKGAGVKIQLPTGKYRYSVTSVSKDGFLSEEAQPDHLIFVDTVTLEKPNYRKVASNDKQMPFKLAIEKNPARSVYGELFYSPFLGEKWDLVEQYKPLKENEWRAKNKLKPGRYEIYLWAVGAHAKNSEKAKEEFVIKPLEKDLDEDLAEEVPPAEAKPTPSKTAKVSDAEVQPAENKSELQPSGAPAETIKK